MFNEDSQNCLHCSMEVTFKCLQLIGIYRRNFGCNHANDVVVPIIGPRFLKLKAIPGIITVIIISIAYCYGASKTYVAIKNKAFIYDLLFTTLDLAVNKLTFCLTLSTLLLYPKLDSQLQHFDSVIRNFARVTSHNLLSIHSIGISRMASYLILIGVCITLPVTAVGLFAYDIDLTWNFVEKLAVLSNINTVGVACFTLLQFLGIYYYAHMQYSNALEMDLENIINNRAMSNENNCIIINFPLQNIQSLLKVYTEMYITFVKTLRGFNDMCSPAFLVVLLCGLYFLIVGVFLVILLIEYELPINIRFLFVGSGILIGIFGAGYATHKFGECSSCNDAILSQLQKFPLSLLNPEEKLQFECFLYIVSKYPTKLEASQIVTIDIELFASILSTLLTYVLVAVQFEFL